MLVCGDVLVCGDILVYGDVLVCGNMLVCGDILSSFDQFWGATHYLRMSYNDMITVFLSGAAE